MLNSFFLNCLPCEVQTKKSVLENALGAAFLLVAFELHFPVLEGIRKCKSVFVNRKQVSVFVQFVINLGLY